MSKNNTTLEAEAIAMSYKTEYDDLALYANSFEKGSKIIVKDYDDNDNEEFHECHIIQTICRSENPEEYDNADPMPSPEDNISYDYSGEFILDNDCYYVFANLI